MGDESTTVLGSDCTFKGEFSFGGAMKVEGRIEGIITSKGSLSLGKGSNVSAEVAVGRLNVEGAFKGSVEAGDRVEVSSTAKFHGDIQAPKLVVSEGATLIGKVSVGANAPKAHHAPAPAPQPAAAGGGRK